MVPRRTHLVLALIAALAMPVAASADTTFTFTGHGYGHGVGMGQYGAQGYALHGWTHQQILAHYYQGTTLGPSGVTQVRVLLQEKLTAAAASAPGGVTAADEGGTATLAVAGPAVVTVRKDATGFSLVDATGAVLASGWTGPVSLTATGGGQLTLAGAALNGVKDGRYRGTMRVLSATDGLQVVNVVSLENYLRGVVASEMPSSWAPEALEAQAIAARTYAVATRKPSSSPFDLYPDERSQVYRGLAGEATTASAAIDATAGQVVLYQGQPIVTYFSSSTGGRTAAVQESLPGVDPEPYLASVDDPYDTLSPYHDWTLSLSDRDLSQQAAYPGLVTGLQVNAYASGRVNTVTLNGTAGPLVLSASLVRKRLGLRSTWFTATPGAPVPKLASQIALHSRVVRNRVLLTGVAPPGAVTLQGAASLGWRDLASHPVADDGAVSFRRPVGEAARYRLVAGSLSSAPVPVIRHSGLVLKGRPGALLHGRLYPVGARGFVALQHVIGGHWTWVARAQTRADGSFRFRVRADGGRWRVRWRGAGSFLGALSPELRVGSRTLAWTPTDPLAAREWNLAAVDAFGYSDTVPVLADAAPVTVAVIDSGIDRNSPDLVGAVPLAPIDEAHDPSTSLLHGTAVAGIIAADANNGIGGVGVGAPYVKLLDYRVVSGGDVDPLVEARAIHDAVGAGARVINLSLGGTRDPKDPSLDEFSRAERDAISYAFKQGTVVVAAVGNSPDNQGIYASWPAALRHVIGVSAVDQHLQWAPFSNTDPVFNDIAAPGVGIITTVPRSLAPTGSSLDAPPGFTIEADGTVRGTSFAAPHVSAAAAVLFARHPDFTPTQVMWILEHTATRLGDLTGMGRDPLTGFGLLDVTAAVKFADGPLASLPPADPDEPNDVASEAQVLPPVSSGSIDAVADFGDDRRDVYKVHLRPGETLRVRTDALPQFGGNLGVDVAVFPPGSTNLAGSPKRALVTARPANVTSSALRVRNTTVTAGFYLVQVSARRGWGAYRLRWTITPGQ